MAKKINPVNVTKAGKFTPTLLEAVKAAIKPAKPAKAKAPKKDPKPAAPKGPDPDEEPRIPAKDIPVESDKPGVARNPKPPKVHVPLKFKTDADQSARIQVLEIHLASLLERLSLEYGGIHTAALVALKGDLKP